jgi:hypothetical protein
MIDIAGRVAYRYEYERRVPCVFIGAGGHSYRNIYPTFQYAPVDLRAVCDLDISRAANFARIFGAGAHYSDHHIMLHREKPTAVFIVTSYDGEGRVQALQLALDCLAAYNAVAVSRSPVLHIRVVRFTRSSFLWPTA